MSVMAPPFEPSSTLSYTVAAEACASVSPPAETSWTRARLSRALRNVSTRGIRRYDFSAPAWTWTIATASWPTARSSASQNPAP